jgi:serine protease Do
MFQKNNKIIYVVLISTFFGLASGIIGTIAARVYILERVLNIPYVGDYSYINDGNGGNLVIQGARKIVIEQNAKVDEVISSAGQVVVGIFDKKNAASAEGPGAYYQKNNELGQGFILTSDGWMISRFSPPGLSAKAIDEKTKKDILSKYVVINKQNEILDVVDIAVDPNSGYAFWRMEGSGFPVRKLIDEKELKNGQLVLAVNWQGYSFLTSIVGISGDGGLVKNSDKAENKIILADNPAASLGFSFLFDLNGGLVGITDKNGEFKTTDSYLPCVNCLLKNIQFKYPSLGLNYVDLSGLVDPGRKKPNRGALIQENSAGIAVAPGGAADKAGLKKGDLILSVNNIELNTENDLARIVSRHIPGDTLFVSYERGGEIKSIAITLEERKL